MSDREVSHAGDSDGKVFYLFIHTFQVGNILNNLSVFPEGGRKGQRKIQQNNKKVY
jgi:hypothetical protein